MPYKSNAASYGGIGRIRVGQILVCKFPWCRQMSAVTIIISAGSLQECLCHSAIDNALPHQPRQAVISANTAAIKIAAKVGLQSAIPPNVARHKPQAHPG